MRTSRVAYPLVIAVVVFACCIGMAQAVVNYQFTFPARPSGDPQWPAKSFTITWDDFLLEADGWQDLPSPVTYCWSTPGGTLCQTFRQWAYTTGIDGQGYCFRPNAPDAAGYPNWMEFRCDQITAYPPPPATPPYSISVSSTTLRIKTVDGASIHIEPGGLLLYSQGDPPLVEMAAMWTDTRRGVITLNWETASEVGTAGFRILRSQDAEPFTVITPSLIPAQGGPTLPARYSWTDLDIVPGQTYRYMIEEVEDSGKTNSFGPLSGMVTQTRLRRR